jgi:PAS domain S-box-containing protein
MEISPVRLASLYNQMPFGFVLLDIQGSPIFLSKTFLDLTGYAEADLLGDAFYDRLFPVKEVNARVREKSLSATTEAFDDLDVVLTNVQNEKVAVHIAGKKVVDEGVEYLALIFQDVTSKKAFEKVIESSFDNFIQVTNALDVAMKKINEQNVILEDYKAKMTRELGIAKNVQKAIIPRVFPKLPGLDIWGVSIPSEELGGDYFDYFHLDDNLIGVLIADVSGHGVPSSLITTMVKAYFEYYTKRYWEPEKVLQNVNRDMSAIITDTGFYLTAFYGVIDLVARKFTVAVAGHDSAMCVVKGKDHPLRMGDGCDGTILGVFPDATYSSLSYELEPDSKVILYTDGITEARSDSGEFFGTERLQNFMLAQVGKSSQETVEELVRNVDAFYGTSAPNDDRTLVVFDVFSSEKSDQEKDPFRRAKKAFLDKDFKAALRDFEKVIAQGSQESDLYYLAGQACCFLKENKKAIQFLERSVELDARAYKSYYYLGIVYHNQKNYDQAGRCWKKVLDIHGDYKDVRELLSKLETN